MADSGMQAPAGSMGKAENKKRIGIAFQGGGFAAGGLGAGVVKGLVEKGAFETFEIDVFSGTSAGALVAAACWCQKLRYLVEHRDRTVLDDLPDLLEKQWMYYALGLMPNTKTVQTVRLMDTIFRLNPAYELWAENVVVPSLRSLMKHWIQEFIQIKDLDELQGKLEGQRMPGLVLGAADVLKGDIKSFTEQDLLAEDKEHRLDLVRASGSLDEVNGYTMIEAGPNKGVYCDGAWGSNPPISPLIDYGVDEIWIVENFPKVRAEMPRSYEERKDRQDELWQNSLVEQEMRQINFVNEYLDALNSARTAKGLDPYRPITVRKLSMLLDLGPGAAFVNSPDFIRKMMGYGYTNACNFMNDRLAGEAIRPASGVAPEEVSVRGGRRALKLSDDRAPVPRPLVAVDSSAESLVQSGQG
jgi:NTE family protein